LSSEPTVAVWQSSHPDGKLELAHYQTAKDPYEVDFARMNRWCAASVSHLPAQMVRAALFYVPAPDSGTVPQTRACRMEAIWYETQGDFALNGLVGELSAVWGQPNGATTTPDIRGSGNWNNAAAWHRQGINIWAVFDRYRLIVYARRDIPRDPDTSFGFNSGIKTQLIDAVAQLIKQDSKLAAEMLDRAHCETRQPRRESDPITIRRLAQWLKTSMSLPPDQKAPALLLADAYVSCSRIPPDSLMQLGAAFRVQCPQDGPSYSHNLRSQAERLDPNGLAGELAGIASLVEPCSLEGKGDWPDLAIAEGERLLIRYNKDQWTPWVHYAIARAHAAKLAFAYPDGRPGGAAPVHLSQEAMRKERDAAVGHFEIFTREKPDVREFAFAWQEAWRLQAGLPPSPLDFDCGCE